MFYELVIDLDFSLGAVSPPFFEQALVESIGKVAAERQNRLLQELAAYRSKIDKDMSLKGRLLRHERDIIKEALAQNDYNIQDTASMLGVSKRTLFYRMKATGIRGNIDHRQLMKYERIELNC